MLGKMIKYDIMFGARKYAVMAALTGALLIVAAAAARLDSMLVTGIAMFLAVIATTIYSIMYIVISVRHLHSQLCSNESYLGYSLPASPHTLVASKLICILIWGVVTAALITFFWAVGIGGIALANSGVTLGDFWRDMSNMLRSIGATDAEIRSALFLLLGTGISISVLTVVLLGFSVSLCNVPFLKERGLGTVTGVVSFFVAGIGINWLVARIGSPFFRGTYSLDEFSGAIAGAGIYLTAAYLIAAIGMYFLTVYIVDKHRFIG